MKVRVAKAVEGLTDGVCKFVKNKHVSFSSARKKEKRKMAAGCKPPHSTE